MKLYFGTKTAWAGDLIKDIIWLCGDHYQPNNSANIANYMNLGSGLVMAAEGILTKNSKRNYRYTIETYFHSILKVQPSVVEQFWNWGQFVLKGRIPFGKVGYYAVQFEMEKDCLTLEVKCLGNWTEHRKASKIGTWRQDILVLWLARYNWEILRAPIADKSRVMCLGEFLASELYHNCGDEAGRLATYDAVEDRGQRWLVS